MPHRLVTAAALGLLLGAMPAAAQDVVPELGSKVQQAIERQVERARGKALERALQQAEAIQGRVVDRTASRQVDVVQQQVAERVGRRVERAQGRIAERAQGEVERVQARVERVQAQAQQVQGQVEQQIQARVAQAQQIQGQVVEQMQSQVDLMQVQAEQAQNHQVQPPPRPVEEAQAQIVEQSQARLERIQSQVERIEGRTERIQSRTEHAQAQAAERARLQIERARKAVEQVASQVERTGEAAADRVEEGLGVIRDLPEQVVEHLPDGITAPAQQAGEEQQIDQAAQAGEEQQIGEAAQGSQEQQIAQGQEAGGEQPVEQDNNDNDLGQSLLPEPTVATTGVTELPFVEIEIEPGIRAIEFEWVMLVNAEQRAQLQGEAEDLLDFLSDSEPFGLLQGGELLTFRVPPDLDANQAILDLVPTNLRGLIDRNHLYWTQDAEAVDSSGKTALAPPSPSIPLPMAAVCDVPMSMGIIDAAVDTTHPAFAHAQPQMRSFVEDKLEQPTAHGTEVAALLVGNGEDGEHTLHPLLPEATLYGAAVFHANDQAQTGATLRRVLMALDWLASIDDIQVINMSLSGPDNRLLEQAVRAVTARGKHIVAAVGNEGPHAPPRYPAAYPEVLGVTAVDNGGQVYRWAGQGKHVDYAALGVTVPTARAAGGYGLATGTSVASPVVAAFLACALEAKGDLAGALTMLDARAVDLGAAGSDPVYGRGLLHPSGDDPNGS